VPCAVRWKLARSGSHSLLMITRQRSHSIPKSLLTLPSQKRFYDERFRMCKIVRAFESGDPRNQNQRGLERTPNKSIASMP